MSNNFHKRFDTALKEIFIQYKAAVARYLNTAEIVEVLNTEFHIVELTGDMAFKLADETGLHIEFQQNIGPADMLRFLRYNTECSARYDMPFQTVVFTWEKPTDEKAEYVIKFEPAIINLANTSVDEQIEKIRSQKDRNVMDIILLPLCKSEQKNLDILKTVKILLEETQQNHEVEKILALQVLLVCKSLNKQNWRDIKMLGLNIEESEFLQAVLEEGMEKGREEGREEGMEKGREEGKQQEKLAAAKEMLKDGLALDVIAKYVKLSKEELSKLLL